MRKFDTFAILKLAPVKLTLPLNATLLATDRLPETVRLDNVPKLVTLGCAFELLVSVPFKFANPLLTDAKRFESTCAGFISMFNC